MVSSAEQFGSRWTHRWAVVLACATFPLLWVGGLVTTTDAGMAVPDWPNTYGYNLFLYPWQTWVSGPWDLFIEHGHRLLASSVGMLTIWLLVLLMRNDDRRWLKVLGVAALALVVFQGVLGGMRVLLDERTLAMLHGCTGPVFFALTVGLVVFTSRSWLNTQPQQPVASAGLIRMISIATAVLAYLQIVFGAVLRHVPVDALPSTFMLAVQLHLALAAVLSLHVVALVWLVHTRARQVLPVSRLSLVLVALLMLQILLGASTWLVKYAVPLWASHWLSPQSFAVQDGGWLQTHVITAHVATGSLILGSSVALALYAQRLLHDAAASQPAVRRGLGAAV
ncbi:MAG: COX15/CtaA family protein [Pirellulales bacterium]